MYDSMGWKIYTERIWIVCSLNYSLISLIITARLHFCRSHSRERNGCTWTDDLEWTYRNTFSYLRRRSRSRHSCMNILPCLFLSLVIPLLLYSCPHHFFILRQLPAFWAVYYVSISDFSKQAPKQKPRDSFNSYLTSYLYVFFSSSFLFAFLHYLFDSLFSLIGYLLFS